MIINIINEYILNFLVLVLISACVERFSVSRMRFFLLLFPNIMDPPNLADTFLNITLMHYSARQCPAEDCPSPPCGLPAFPPPAPTCPTGDWPLCGTLQPAGNQELEGTTHFERTTRWRAHPMEGDVQGTLSGGNYLEIMEGITHEIQ